MENKIIFATGDIDGHEGLGTDHVVDRSFERNAKIPAAVEVDEKSVRLIFAISSRLADHKVARANVSVKDLGVEVKGAVRLDGISYAGDQLEGTSVFDNRFSDRGDDDACCEVLLRLQTSLGDEPIDAPNVELGDSLHKCLLLATGLVAEGELDDNFLLIFVRCSVDSRSIADDLLGTGEGALIEPKFVGSARIGLVVACFHLLTLDDYILGLLSVVENHRVETKLRVVHVHVVVLELLEGDVVLSSRPVKTNTVKNPELELIVAEVKAMEEKTCRLRVKDLDGGFIQGADRRVVIVTGSVCDFDADDLGFGPGVVVLLVLGRHEKMLDDARLEGDTAKDALRGAALPLDALEILVEPGHVLLPDVNGDSVHFAL